MKKLLTICAVALILGGCAAATPIIMGGGVNHLLVMSEENIRLRKAAALEEEPDLLTYSLIAVSRKKTEDVVNTYMKSYGDDKYSKNIKSLALYQVGLIYMNRYNDGRNDDLALTYFNRHHIEYANSRLYPAIEKRIQIIKERRNSSTQYTAAQLLSQLDREALLNKPRLPFDEELTPMSERAITNGRTDDAEAVYLIVYDNPASSENVRAKALYQLGLIYMSPYNTKANDKRALMYFRKVINEFSKTPVSKRAQQKVSTILNAQG